MSKIYLAAAIMYLVITISLVVYGFAGKTIDPKILIATALFLLGSRVVICLITGK